MIKLIFVICSFFVLTTLFAQNKIKVVIYSDENYTPYSYSMNNKSHGIYSEIVFRVFSKMKKYDIKIVPAPWSRALKLIEDGVGFALFPPYYHPYIRPYIKYYSDPILLEEVVVVCNKTILESRKFKKWPDDFYGLTIGNNKDFVVAGDEFYKALKKNMIKISNGKTTRINVSKLIHSHIDCYVNDKNAIMWQAKKLNVLDQIGIAKVINYQYGYLGISNSMKFDSFRDHFITTFNSHLQELKKTGVIKAIKNRYLR